MGAETDKIIGRAKQALGAITGNKKTKSDGERQENKRKLKGKGQLNRRHGAGHA